MMKDIFLHRLKIKDAFLRNAGVVRNTIFYRAIFPNGNIENAKLLLQLYVGILYLREKNVQFPIMHSVRNASLGRKNRQSLTLHSVGMHPQNQQRCYLK